jgi:hypothetical protein
LDTVTEGNCDALTDPKQWKVAIELNGKEEEFKVDTCAKVTAISEQTYQQIGTPELLPPSKSLNGPAEHKLEVLGEFEGQIKYKNNTTTHPNFVIKGLKTNLLGLSAITSLQLAYRLNHIGGPDSPDWIKEYPEVFNGLGTMGDPYEINLKPNAQPHAIFSPRKVPLSYRLKLKIELQRMESLGVISRVEEPTPWCAGIVCTPKKNGDIRICVDLRQLNQSVQREVYPLPTIDDLLVQTTNAKVLSKLDANSGFWQIPLSRQSSSHHIFNMRGSILF